MSLTRSIDPPAEGAERFKDVAGSLSSRGSSDTELYQLDLDSAGIIRGRACGVWNIDQTRRYCAALKALVDTSRRSLGKVRVLLDRREISLQSTEVCALLADANRTIFTGEDKIALIVVSSVTKVSLRHRMPHAGTKAFLSLSAAELWLSV